MYRRESAHVIPPPCGARRAIARPPRWCKSRRRNWLRLSDRLGPTAEPIRVYPTFSCVLPCAFYPVLSFAGNRGTIRGVVWWIVDGAVCFSLRYTPYIYNTFASCCSRPFRFALRVHSRFDSLPRASVFVRASFSAASRRSPRLFFLLLLSFYTLQLLLSVNVMPMLVLNEATS